MRSRSVTAAFNCDGSRSYTKRILTVFKMKINDLLSNQGYKVVEDAWASNGRVTYIHGDDADQAHLAELARVLGSVGWTKSRDKLRSFEADSCCEIEIEPGGADTSGHFLHLVKKRS
jgi:hypothetical protein